MVKGPHLRTLGILRILRAAADILAVVSGKPHLNLKSASFTQIDGATTTTMTINAKLTCPLRQAWPKNYAQILVPDGESVLQLKECMTHLNIFDIM